MFKNIGLLALLFKVGPILLKLLKSVKFIKIALAGGSMLAYSYLFTWEFALILLGSIVFHEYGHITAMKKCGLKTKGIFLIPFMGGAAVPEDDFKNRRDEAFVALYGPFYGLILTIPFLVYGLLFNSPLAMGLVSFMALINLFNLVPINPLDGGRVIKSISFSMNSSLGVFSMFGGLLFALWVVYMYHIWLLVFIIFIGTIELFFEYRDYKSLRSVTVPIMSFEDFVSLHSQDKLSLEELKNSYDKSINFIQTQREMFYKEKNLKKNEILKYSVIYFGLALVFIGLIFYTSQYEGADLALKLLKDDLN